MLANDTEQEMMTQADEQEHLTSHNSHRQLGRGVSKFALVGTLAFALVGFVLFFQRETNHATLVSDTEGTADIVSLRKEKEEEEKNGPDYEKCEKQCGKLAVGCKAKSATYKTLADAKAHTAAAFCDSKCAVTKFTKNTKTGLEGWVGHTAVGKGADVVSNKFEVMKPLLDGIETVTDTILETRTRILHFEAQVHSKMCLSKCYAKQAQTAIYAIAESKKGQMICYYAQSKAYALEKLSQELDEVKAWANDWIDEKEHEVKTKIDDLYTNLTDKMEHVEEEIKSVTHDLMMDAVQVTTGVYDKYVLPVYETYQTVNAGVRYVIAEVNDLEECIEDAISDAKMIGQIPSLLLGVGDMQKLTNYSAAQSMVVAFSVRGLVILFFSIAMTF